MRLQLMGLLRAMAMAPCFITDLIYLPVAPKRDRHSGIDYLVLEAPHYT